MSAPRVSRWSRRFVAAGATFFLAWALVTLLGMGRRIEVVLALYGFVLHTVFGKSYALVPAYFDRTLGVSWAPAAQFPLSTGGVIALAVGTRSGVPAAVAMLGAVAWFAGVLVWLGALGWTVRDNLTGAETGTGDHQAARRPVDRLSNAVVPVVGLYLLAGSYELLAGAVGLPTLLDGTAPRISHLLGAGSGALLVFAVGFRLFPRFLVAQPPRLLVGPVLAAGAVGPALLAAGLYSDTLLLAGGAVEGFAVLGFATVYAVLYARSERERVGLRAVLVAVFAGVVAVAIAGHLAVAGRSAQLIELHYRFALAGFLGLTIVGAALQFYPPSVGDWPGSDDRTALVAIALVAGGLLLQLGGLLVDLATILGQATVLAGVGCYAYLLASAFAARS